MLRGIGPRFYVEAGFLIAVAALLAAQRVGPVEIVVAMLVAYLAVFSTELLLARRRAPATAPARSVEPAEPPADDPEVEVASAIVAVHPAEPEQADAPEKDRAAGDPEPELEPEIAQVAPVAAPVLVAVPEPEPEPEPDPEPESVRAPEHEPEPVVVAAAFPQEPRAWNLWELDRLVRRRTGDDPLRDEEWGYLLVYLRDFASPEGFLPEDFDTLVRESFGDVLEAAAAR